MKTRGMRLGAAGALLLLALTACGPGEPAVMPDVVGLQLDVAKSDIERAGFGEDVEIVGGGLFGVLDDSNWVVCDQQPVPGKSVSNPRLVVERECVVPDTSSTEPVEPVESLEPEEPTQPEEPAETSDAVKTTVDKLLDSLNSAEMGGIQVGDKFRFTGELVSEDLWYTGRTGDYVVSFTAHDGADDLMVLLDESEATGWVGGTRLEAIVENVEITLDGETTDGWLRLVSATLAN